MSLALRSLFWTLAFPGFFAGFLPWRYFGLSAVDVDWRNPLHMVGVLTGALGAALLIACIVEFARRGRGTLSPADPPKELVVQGLYRYVRNPMYLAVSTIVLGEVMLTRSTDLFIYWVIWFLCANIFVRAYEEPTLRRQFGEPYEHYARNVGRWIPRLPGRAFGG
jgi:protein-S-isoprenylcysteine O-methyltransferase Ste14